MIAYLKYIRRAIALLFFTILTISFIGYSFLGLQWATALQFIPSLLKFFIVSTSIGFFVIIAITLLVGRVYCSVICPLGILQDVIARIGRSFRKLKIYRYTRANNYLRYGFLLAIIISLFSGSILAFIFFDPYSLYGKIASATFRPAFILLNDMLSKLFEHFNIFITPIGLKNFSLVTFVVALFLLVTIIAFSYRRGRLYCNTICPVGTILSLLSRISLFKIQIQQSKCTRCGKCSTVCKSECIDIRNQKVDFDRCVGCYNCLTVCSENGINFKTFETKAMLRKIKPTEPVNENRRSFLGALITGLIGTSILTSIKAQSDDSNYKSLIPIKKKHPVTPPGSQSLAHLTEHCTACHLCVSQCPTHVLKPAVKEYGLIGFMMPYMSYSDSFCNFECKICSEVCPTGALLPLTVEQKKTLQIGKVFFIKENCIVYTSETSCGACAEHCPTAAVHMVVYKGSLRIPDTDQSICIGCGACEYACPAKPYKAIYVEGNPVHLVAQKPKEKLQETEAPSDFPF
ncbi:MAG: 4Fe-4S binding protein [Bacteroidales bacterium]|nr:4Fe-4S binding protein [Bacteroidales bacterium]